MPKIILPTVQQMRLFEAVARHGSITRAAEEAHLTQPSVSMQVRTLEDKIGQPLTEMAGKSLRLTRAGEEVAAAARDVLSRLDDMKMSLEAMRSEVGGPLSVAVVSSAKYVLPGLLGAFKRLHPRIRPQLTIANRETLLARIRRSADDLYIIGRPPQEDILALEPFTDNVIVFTAPPDHPLASTRNISLARLAQENVIGREAGSGTRAAVERVFEGAGVSLPTLMEFDDAEAIKQAIASGLGVAYLSHHAIRLELAAGELTLLDVTGFPLRRRWFVGHRRGKHLGLAAQTMLAFLRDEAAGGA